MKSWKFQRECQMNKRKPIDKNATVKSLQNLNPIGQYEHLRLKDEESGIERFVPQYTMIFLLSISVLYLFM